MRGWYEQMTNNGNLYDTDEWWHVDNGKILKSDPTQNKTFFCRVFAHLQSSFDAVGLCLSNKCIINPFIFISVAIIIIIWNGRKGSTTLILT